ncbi:MAG: hypothetical protein QM286_00495 [Acidobacteriota bacterium]|nr:hypothetical protein [Acidobacteriota bacterium]
MARSSYYLAPAGSVSVPAATLLDMSISGLALGLLVWMRARPPGAPQGYREFLNRGFGEKATRDALGDLEKAGYRWRFVERRDLGRIVTATLLFDRPVGEQEARKTLESLSPWPIGKCLSSTKGEEQHALSDRADHAAARRDKGKYPEMLVTPGIGETPSGTVPRSTAARSTAARSTAAQPSNDGSREPKGSRPNQTSTARDLPDDTPAPTDHHDSPTHLRLVVWIGVKRSPIAARRIGFALV